MFFKKKKPWVRFVNMVPGVELAHPIIRTQDYSWDVLKNAAKDFKEKLENRQPHEIVQGTFRCPGISALLKTGFIIPCPGDFIIKTDSKEQPGGFMWDSLYKFEEDGGGSLLGFHGPEMLASYIPFRKDTLSTVVKVQTSWRLFSSDDIVFLQMPIPYPNHTNFTAVHGILDPQNFVEVNVQLHWHVLDGRTLIKAGTPLCQLIPIPRELAVDLEVDHINEQEKYANSAWKYLVTYEYLRDMKTFLKNAKKVKNLINK